MREAKSPPASLFIRLLGPLQVVVQGHPLPAFPSRKPLWLLALLTLYSDRTIERGFVAGTLWPQSQESRAFANLRNALYDLRRALGSQAYRLTSANKHTLCLDLSGAEVDVLAFDAALAKGDAVSLEQAVSLYRGPLLEGCQEEWIFAERQAREQAYLSALERLAELEMKGSKPALAAAYLRRAIGVDPLRESLQRNLMQTLAAKGDYNAALQTYRELRLLLYQEMHTEPDATTQALFQQIRQQARQPRSLERSGPPSLTQTAPSYLPMQFTRFFGREAEIARLMALLLPGHDHTPPTTRLLTLTGAGGTGKTRLAIEAANQLIERFPGRILFVPLADLSDARLIPTAILDSLRLPPTPDLDPLEQIVAFLSHAPALLILDNLEHLLFEERRKSEDGASVVRLLLERIPTLICLVTSRQRLNLEGEQELALLPLAAPDLVNVTPEQGIQYASVQLFVDRAQAVRTDFALTDHNAAAVAALCQRLEGIPLAIELAAARAQVLTPSQMLAQLGHRFDFLVSRRRDAIDRHRTLRAAIEWSYRLLSPELQRFFTCLSVFRGGWTVEAAEQVCKEAQALGYLEQLRECSLVLAEESGEEMRYRMLETLREYAWEQMSQEGRIEIQRQHLGFFLTLAEEAEPKLPGAEQGVWLERLDAEHDNLRSALEWCLAVGKKKEGKRKSDGEERAEQSKFQNRNSKIAEAGLRLAGALGRFWKVRGHLSEGRAYLAEVLECTGAAGRTQMRVKALQGAGMLASRQGDNGAARAFHEESLAINQELGDKPGIAASLTGLGAIAYYQSDYEAAKALDEQSLAIRRELGDKQGMATSLNNLGTVARNQGEYERAKALHTESLAIQRELEDKRSIADSLNNLGTVAAYQGDYRTFRALSEESLMISWELGNQWGIANSLSNLGNVTQQQGDFKAARMLYEQSLAIRQELGNKHGIAFSLEELARLAVIEGQSERAVLLWGAAEALRETISSPLPLNERELYAQNLAAVREMLDEEAFAAAWEQGRVMTLEQAIEFALEENRKESKERPDK